MVQQPSAAPKVRHIFPRDNLNAVSLERELVHAVAVFLVDLWSDREQQQPHYLNPHQ
jgi:hypothetical protein